jgi:hypothetical protein
MTHPLPLRVLAGETVNYLRNADVPRIEASSPGRGSKMELPVSTWVIHKRGADATLVSVTG